MREPSTTDLPLRGVRVIEVSQVLTAAYAAMVLADLGADVVKVEQPGRGDMSRRTDHPTSTTPRTTTGASTATSAA